MGIFAFADHRQNLYHTFGGRTVEGEELLPFPPPRKCPYCKVVLAEFQDDISGYPTIQEQTLFFLSACERCGWWLFHLYAHDGQPKGMSSTEEGVAVLKEFNVKSPDVPFRELAAYLARNEDSLFDIAPEKFEALVADVYRDVLGYKVEFCSYGRPDRGIDVICITKDTGESLAIQVKRYRRPIRLSLVHEFCGALIESNNRSGVLVTSSRFQRGCAESTRLIRKNAGISIDLVDGKRFLEFLGLLNKQPLKVQCPLWDKHPTTPLDSLNVRVQSPTVGARR